MSRQSTIDSDHLEKYVAGDYALRDEILVIFSEQINTLSRGFDTAQSDEAWRNTAHSAKGCARGVGAWRLGDLCEEAEGLIGSIPGKLERRAALLVSIRRSIEDALGDAERLRARAA